jgi:hypothetical protein
MSVVLPPLLLALSMALSPPPRQPPDCGTLDRRGNDEGVRIPGHLAIHKVIGEGRLPFHSGPDARCAIPDVFIIPNDEVIAYVEYGGFTFVMYLKKDGGDASGWVRSERLRGTGTGISPE